MSRYSYEEIARDYGLWCTYVDPFSVMTEDEFNRMTLDEKIELQKRLFGDEQAEEEDI